jgi:DNA anti-recombination protein RmuC
VTNFQLQFADLKHRVEIVEAQNSAASGFVNATNEMASKIHHMVKQLNEEAYEKIDQAFNDKFQDVVESLQAYQVVEDCLDALVKLMVCGEQLTEVETAQLQQILSDFLTRGQPREQLQ